MCGKDITFFTRKVDEKSCVDEKETTHVRTISLHNGGTACVLSAQVLQHINSYDYFREFLSSISASPFLLIKFFNSKLILPSKVNTFLAGCQIIVSVAYSE